MSEGSAGRGRGRGRGEASQAAAPVATAPTVAAGRGRGRGRGEAAAASSSASPVASPVQAPGSTPSTVAAVTAGVADISISGDRPLTRYEVREKAKAAMAKKPDRAPDMEKQLASSESTIFSNHFTLNTDHPFIYQYHVAFSPTNDSRAMRYSMIASHVAVIGETFAFDGMQLFLTKRLPDAVTYLKSVRAHDNQEFEITLQFASELSSAQCFQLYNILFRKILRLLKLKQIGRHYFDPNKPSDIPQHNMQLWPGYATAIHDYDNGPLLNIDLAHKVLRTDTVLDHIENLKKKFRGEADLRDAAHEYLVGQVVLTRYNNKTYAIDGVDWNQNPGSSFKLANGTSKTYAEYYMEHYNKSIRDMRQPLLIHKAKPKKGARGEKAATQETIFLVPELCCMTGFTDEVRADFRIMKDISQHTIIAPRIRKEQLEKFISNLYANPEIKQELERWRIKFGRELLRVPGRILNPETIAFRNNKIRPDPNAAEWSRDMKQVEVIEAIPLRNWICIFHNRNENEARSFCDMLSKVSRPFGIQVGSVKPISLQRDGAGDFVNAIRQNYQHGSTQLVVCILPNDRKDRYDAIKKYCIAETGIVSQCVLSKTIGNQKIAMSATTKIALQINVKLGGQLWGVEIPTKGTMVIGIDVYHDSVQKGMSCVGFCASMNAAMTKYYSRVLFQRSGQELTDQLQKVLPDALNAFKAINQDYPNRIIMFRDGVGEGQLQTVALHEYPQMKETCARVGGAGYDPKVAFVVVQKRIGTRLMEAAGNQVNNPRPGTLVTSGCTGKDSYDYFICAQSVRQGTSTPTHYQVVHDSSQLKAIQLQAITFKLTHLYYNWPGTVRVPAPCQYAHKLAFLIGQSVHKDPHNDLNDKLYFL